MHRSCFVDLSAILLPRLWHVTKDMLPNELHQKCFKTVASYSKGVNAPRLRMRGPMSGIVSFVDVTP